MKKINLSMSFDTDGSMTNDEAIALVKRLIGAGVEDAQRTIDEDEGDTDAAKTAVSIAGNIAIQPLKARCLVIVTGGVADVEHDECVEVEVLDLDNSSRLVSANFADLARLR